MSYQSSQKILGLDALLFKVNAWRVTGQKVVFTNGCFDLIHLGHTDYLEKASQLGNKLIVGLNTDASVSKLKGSGRPILDEYTRARVLAALGFVEAIILFGEDTPLELIKHIKPDVLVKGADYQVEEIVGHEIVHAYGGKVARVDLVEGYSTTALIHKIQAMAD